jgi:hypothetical protein
MLHIVCHAGRLLKDVIIVFKSEAGVETAPAAEEVLEIPEVEDMSEFGGVNVSECGLDIKINGFFRWFEFSIFLK